MKYRIQWKQATIENGVQIDEKIIVDEIVEQDKRPGMQQCNRLVPGYKEYGPDELPDIKKGFDVNHPLRLSIEKLG
jgi:hypothetical protein